MVGYHDNNLQCSQWRKVVDITTFQFQSLQVTHATRITQFLRNNDIVIA